MADKRKGGNSAKVKKNFSHLLENVGSTVRPPLNHIQGWSGRRGLSSDEHWAHYSESQLEKKLENISSSQTRNRHNGASAYMEQDKREQSSKVPKNTCVSKT